MSESKEKEKMDLRGNDMEYASIIDLKRRIKSLLTGRTIGPVANEDSTLNAPQGEDLICLVVLWQLFWESSVYHRKPVPISDALASKRHKPTRFYTSDVRLQSGENVSARYFAISTQVP